MGTCRRVSADSDSLGAVFASALELKGDRLVHAISFGAGRALLGTRLCALEIVAARLQDSFELGGPWHWAARGEVQSQVLVHGQFSCQRRRCV